MPIRIVREGINSSARINALSRGAELFYRRLMSVVDDYGRFHGSPATLRGACWPTCPENVTEDEVKQWLEECLQVHSKCLAGATPLIFLYEANGFKYLQLTDFRQQTRSESKFPDPANQLHSTCDQNDQPRRRRNSETKTEFEDEDGNVRASESTSQSPEILRSAPPWMIDESFVPFAELSRKFWPRILEEELMDGHRFYWGKMSIEDRLMATKNLRTRLDADEDGEYVKHMPDYLKSEWKRGPKKSAESERKNGHHPTESHPAHRPWVDQFAHLKEAKAK